METERFRWDDLFILLAMAYSTRGTCDRLKTGCVLVKDNKEVAAGYNGAVAGTANCNEVGHQMEDGHCIRTIHAEKNAIHNSVVHDLTGSTAYCVASPCHDCAKDLLQRGIKRIVYIMPYANNRGKDKVKDLCDKKGVWLQRWSESPTATQVLLNQLPRILLSKGGILLKLGEIAAANKKIDTV